MYIDTHTRETMQLSICKFLRVTSEDLATLFDQVYHEAQNGVYFDGYKFNEIVNGFINSHHTDDVIDKILFFHLAKRLNTAQEDVVGYNLEWLLTNQTALSSFLKQYGVEFRKNGEHIEMFDQGNRISLEDTFRSNVPYLRNRLGYNKGHEDYCFNGFAFKDLLLKNSYARELEDVPEFVGILATFLKKRALGTDYYQNSTYYCYEYCAPLEMVMFDNNDKLLLDEKRQYLLQQVLSRLYEYEKGDHRYMTDHDNPIIRLSDTDVMSAEFFVSKEEIIEDMIRW